MLGSFHVGYFFLEHQVGLLNAFKGFDLFFLFFYFILCLLKLLFKIFILVFIIIKLVVLWLLEADRVCLALLWPLPNLFLLFKTELHWLEFELTVILFGRWNIFVIHLHHCPYLFFNIFIIKISVTRQKLGTIWVLINFLFFLWLRLRRLNGTWVVWPWFIFLSVY